MRRRTTPEVNAGSMADIAFLLLIFFLVTTTIEKDKGIARQLPPALTDATEAHVKEKNLLQIMVNPENEILVEEKRVSITDLKEVVIAFLDNGGIPMGMEGHCDYCLGEHSLLSSDNPQKAVISLAPDRLTDYNTYIQVQAQLTAAYEDLRQRAYKRLYKQDYSSINKAVREGSYDGNLEKVKMQLKKVRSLYPMLISEATTKRELRL